MTTNPPAGPATIEEQPHDSLQPSRATSGAAVHTQAVNAFSDAMATGFGVVAVIVLVAALSVARGLHGTSPS